MRSGVSRPAGALVGHTEGITHVSARGDGRHIVSNGKDCTARVWDVRAARSSVPSDCSVRSAENRKNITARATAPEVPRRSVAALCV